MCRGVIKWLGAYDELHPLSFNPFILHSSSHLYFLLLSAGQANGCLIFCGSLCLCMLIHTALSSGMLSQGFMGMDWSLHRSGQATSHTSLPT